MDSILTQINSLLYPYVLGFRSGNGGDGFIVTNHSCNQFRAIGSRSWQHSSVTLHPDTYNKLIEVVVDKTLVGKKLLDNFLKDEGFIIDEDSYLFLHPENGESIQRWSKPYFLALRGDLQSQYHYCLMKVDPMVATGEQLVAYLFPGTQFDIYDKLPKKETTNQYSPLVGGSLGWLSHLDVFGSTLSAIEAAKTHLE